jgi:ribosomal protein L11 methyltransferase
VANPSVALRFRVTVDAEDSLQGWMMVHATINGIEDAAGEMLFYIPEVEWTPELQAAVTQYASENTGVTLLGSEVLEDRDWNAEWEASIEPQWATKELVIAPSWKMDEAKALGAKHLITVDPKMSFGTGHHETTRLCLHAIEHLDLTGKRVLDIGTGSGVLAIYSLMRDAQHAIGIDTDSWSVENAEENCGLNDLKSQQLEIRKGMLSEAVQGDERFDVILANIHRNVLIEIAFDIRSHIVAGGCAILSGLLIYDVDEVRAVYESAGFSFVIEERENEWAALIFAKQE